MIEGTKIRTGLIGAKLGHSFSPRIHKELADSDAFVAQRLPFTALKVSLRGRISAFDHAKGEIRASKCKLKGRMLLQ